MLVRDSWRMSQRQKRTKRQITLDDWDVPVASCSPFNGFKYTLLLSTRRYCEKMSLFITDYTYITKLLLLLYYGKTFNPSEDKDKPSVCIAKSLGVSGNVGVFLNMFENHRSRKPPLEAYEGFLNTKLSNDRPLRWHDNVNTDIHLSLR